MVLFLILKAHRPLTPDQAQCLPAYVFVGSFCSFGGGTFGGFINVLLQASRTLLGYDTQGRIPLPNRLNFWKHSKRTLAPRPSFLENYAAIFLQWIWSHLCKEAQARQYQLIINISSYQLISIQLLEKHTLNPEITLLFINFTLKKSCLKFPKSAA